MPAAQFLRITSLKVTVYRRPTAKRLPHGLLPGACAKRNRSSCLQAQREKNSKRLVSRSPHHRSSSLSFSSGLSFSPTRDSSHVESHDGSHNFQTPTWDEPSTRRSWVRNIHSSATMWPCRVVVVPAVR